MATEAPTTTKFFRSMWCAFKASREDVAEKWFYAGGSEGSRLEYFNQVAPKGSSTPAASSNCMCGTKIKENCYITDDFGDLSRYAVVGSCCIKKFLGQERQKKTCPTCGEPHSRRSTPYCYNCEPKRCLDCNCEIEKRFSRCYRCYRKNTAASSSQEQPKMEVDWTAMSVADLEVQKLSSETTYAQSLQAISVVSRKLDELEAFQTQQDAEVEGLNSKRSKVLEDLEAARAKCKELEHEANTLDHEIDDLECGLSSRKKRMREFETEKKLMEEQVEEVCKKAKKWHARFEYVKLQEQVKQIEEQKAKLMECAK